MLVGIIGDRPAVLLEITLRLAQIIERRFGGDKGRMHDPARRIVDVSDQSALRAAVLKPEMLRAIDLDELAHTLPAVPRLMDGRQAMPAVTPEPVLDHPFAQRLPANRQIMPLSELLGGKGRAEIRIKPTNQRKDGLSKSRVMAPIARTAALARRKPRRAILAKSTQQAPDLALTHMQPGGRLTRREPAFTKIHDDLQSVQFRSAHAHYRHRPVAPEIP